MVRGADAADEHEFWPDGLGFDDIHLRGVVGHKQVTDAYLAGLARSKGGRLATLDRALTSPEAARSLAMLLPGFR